MMRTLILAAALLATPAIAARPDDQAKLDKLLAGRTPGKPVDCLPLSRYTTSRTIGSTVAYQVAGIWYVNRFNGGCRSLNGNRTLVSRHYAGRICRGDIADVTLQQPPGTPVGVCTFDNFTPYEKKK